MVAPNEFRFSSAATASRMASPAMTARMIQVKTFTAFNKQLAREGSIPHSLGEPDHMTVTFLENEQDFRVYGLRNEKVELRVLPELGARVVSLRDLHTGREWMWHPPGA